MPVQAGTQFRLLKGLRALAPRFRGDDRIFWIESVRVASALVLAFSFFVLAQADARAAVVYVDVRGIAFVPAAVKVHAGDVVEWTNRDFVDHTATAQNGAWDVKLPVGKTGRVTLTKAGAIDYYCRVHPNMKGKIDVRAR